jgi:hypothetical protein
MLISAGVAMFFVVVVVVVVVDRINIKGARHKAQSHKFKYIISFYSFIIFVV